MQLTTGPEGEPASRGGSTKRFSSALPCALALLLAPAAFAQKIAIVTFDGPGANEVRNQLVSELCDRAECVAQAKVSTKGKIDWKKVKKLRVKYVLDGRVIAKGKKKTIELQVMAKAGAGKKKSWPLTGGELSDRNLKSAGEVIGGLMKLAKEEPEEEAPVAKKAEEKPPPEEKPAPDEEQAEEKPVKKVTEPPPPPKEEEEKPAAEKPAEEEPSPEEPFKARNKRPVVAVEVGLDVSSKTYSYNQVATPNLRSYRAPFIIGPAFKAEVYPLALVTDGLVAGLGAEVGYFLALGLKSRRSGTDVSYPTSISRLDVGVKFQIRPSSKSEAYVAPVIGYRSHSFSVAPGSDGSRLDGLPAINYSALKFGVAGELPFGETGLLVFGKFSLLPVLSASEVIGPTPSYFPNGSVLGIDGGLGLGFKLPFLSMLQVRLSFDFARYGLSFRAAATDTYVAEGAVDQYLGGTLAVRFTY